MTLPSDRPSSLRPLRPVLLSVLALALAACASTGGLEPKAMLLDADSLQTQRTLANPGLSQPGWPSTDWWRALGDPQLDALIAEGLQRNPGLDAADARLRQARAQIGTARADRLPSVSASGGYTGVRLPESMVGDELGGSYAGSGQAYLSVSYGIDLWGGKRAAWEAAVDSGHAAAVDAQAARLNLSAAIAEAYAQLGYAWQLHDVASEELVRAQKTLDLTRQRRAPASTATCRPARPKPASRPRSSSGRPRSSRSTKRAPRWPRWSGRARTAACRSNARRCSTRSRCSSRACCPANCSAVARTSSPRAGAWKQPSAGSTRPRRSSIPA